MTLRCFISSLMSYFEVLKHSPLLLRNDDLLRLLLIDALQQVNVDFVKASLLLERLQELISDFGTLFVVHIIHTIELASNFHNILHFLPAILTRILLVDSPVLLE